MKTLRGKYLVRIGKNSSGDKKVIICGVFNPIDFDINTIHDNDEMWISDIIINGGIKFSDSKDTCSPEDFLEGTCQLPDNWKNKEVL